MQDCCTFLRIFAKNRQKYEDNFYHSHSALPRT